MKKIICLLLLLTMILPILPAADAYTVEVCGRSFSADAEEIDLSDIAMTDTAMVEKALPSFPNLKKVIMCRCGLDDPTMDALNRKYDDIRFVWELSFGQYKRRTDDTVFAPVTQSLVIWGDDLAELGSKLRYMTDLEIVDLGHHRVRELSWMEYTPKLTHFILCLAYVTDLTPISYCKDLVYLELILMEQVEDLSPLVELTKLEDLNIGNMQADPTPILQMTWLKHLWANQSPRAREVLDGNMPETCQTSFSNSHATDGGWRQLERYYEMRDAMGMPYLNQ